MDDKRSRHPLPSKTGILPWEPKTRIDSSELGRWAIRGHEVGLLERVVHDQRYPWREIATYIEYAGECFTCPETRFRWHKDKNKATVCLEDHIEESEIVRHASHVLDEARSHQVHLV